MSLCHEELFLTKFQVYGDSLNMSYLLLPYHTHHQLIIVLLQEILTFLLQNEIRKFYPMCLCVWGWGGEKGTVKI